LFITVSYLLWAQYVSITCCYVCIKGSTIPIGVNQLKTPQSSPQL
jgi:hypothetical protein